MALTKKQLEERRNGIGGSDAAAICSLSKYKSPYGVYLEKVGEAPQSNLEDNRFIEWGNRLESVIADYFGEKNNVVLEERETKWHKKHNFMFANIDRFIVCKNAILEIKTADKYLTKMWGREGTDSVPLEYLLQCCHYAAVWDVDVVHVAVLIGGNDIRQYVYERDLDLEESLIEYERNFWYENVLKRVPPNAETSKDILSKYPNSKKGSEVVATEEAETIVKQIKALQSKVKEESQDLTRLKVELQEIMGEGEILVDGVGGVLATWKSSKEKSSFSLSDFKEDNKDLYEKYVKKSKGNRPLLIK